MFWYDVFVFYNDLNLIYGVEMLYLVVIVIVVVVGWKGNVICNRRVLCSDGVIGG